MTEAEIKKKWTLRNVLRRMEETGNPIEVLAAFADRIKDLESQIAGLERETVEVNRVSNASVDLLLTRIEDLEIRLDRHEGGRP